MKRVLTIAFVLILCTILSACMKQSNSNPTNVPPSEDVQQPTTQVKSAITNKQKLFDIEYIPVASSNGYFIVCNESRNLYGLVDSAGRFVLPLEYGKISFFKAKSQTVLKVESRGSYGIYDLNGRVLIPCEYTTIFLSPYYDSCIVKTFVNKEGVFNLDGSPVLPVEFDGLTFGYGSVFVSTKYTSDQSAANITVFNIKGEILKEFLSTKGTIFNISVGSGENALRVAYRQEDETFFLNGLSTWSDTITDGEHIVYFLGDNLIVKDVNTQEETSIWTFPEGQKFENFQIYRGSSWKTDPISNMKYLDVNVYSVDPDFGRNVVHQLRVSFSIPISVFEYEAQNLEQVTYRRSIEDELGNYYDGLAMVLPKSGYLYIINTDGNKVFDISAPYSARGDCFLLENSAVLNNNGFYSIVGFNGETLLSKTGYSKVQKLNVPGLYAVTDQNGMLGLINEYAEELVPCGGVESVQTCISRPDTDDWDLESSHYTREELYVIYNGGKWAVYSSRKSQLVTDFIELDGDSAIQHDCVLGKGGYALINEERDNAYLISYKNDSYQVSALASLA